jgi:glutamate formiminotransferase/formiminotetrahydrofolate cyclodeaminase
MPTSIVECIPNFSEARKPEVIEKILQSIQSVNGISVLDRHSDLDHNRTVITFVGSQQNVLEAAFRSIDTARQLIDMDRHSGAHPRIGAADVVPFVPIRNFTMQECVEMARQLGKRVGEELSIPVYLYEEAATRLDRKNLEDIRKGEYETLKIEIATNPDRQPDFGPARLSSAGATVIGARNPLIAFNIYLTTNEVWIAQEIARSIRHSSGGMRFVKALGLLVEGRAQVSMNLTNFRQTPIARVAELVRREAARYGVGIHHSELVGLIPQEALVDASSWYMQIDALKPDQILEQRLYEVTSAKEPAPSGPDQPSFLDELSRGTPSPGGGSAAAYTAAEAAALVAMVARLTVGRPRYNAVESEMWQVIEQAEQLRKDLTLCVSQDAEAFEKVLVARRLPKLTPDQQMKSNQAIISASEQACLVPFHVIQKLESVLDLALRVAKVGNQNALTDAAAAVVLGKAAMTSAGLNIKTNAQSIPDSQIVQSILEKISEIDRHAAQTEAEIFQVLRDRQNLAA